MNSSLAGLYLFSYNQESKHHGPKSNPSPSPVFVQFYSVTCCLWLLGYDSEELTSYNRVQGTELQEKACPPLQGADPLASGREVISLPLWVLSTATVAGTL